VIVVAPRDIRSKMAGLVPAISFRAKLAPAAQRSSFVGKDHAMPEITADKGIVTQITTVSVAPDKQDDAPRLMQERARFMAQQPGFVSISLHRSTDGAQIVNYVQWKNREQLEAAHHSPEFRDKWPEFGKLIEDAEPALYEVVMVEES
jgi:quinol monooxygenase YgiN